VPVSDEQAPWYDVSSERAAIVALLHRLGADDDEIREAFAAGSSGDFAVELVLREGRTPLSVDEAASAAGVSPEDFLQLWRALGFLEPDRGQRAIPAALAEALPVVATATRDWLGDDTSHGLARVIGNATAQLAEAVVDAFRIGFEVPQLSAGTSYSDVVEQYVELTRVSMPAFEALVSATLRAHIVRAARGMWAPDEERLATSRERFVAFADLVGYTALSRTMSPGELATMLSRFEETAAEAVTARQARVVKLLGDAVMFVSESPADGCAAALTVCERISAAGLPPVRVGADHGSVLSRAGDYYGDVVNRAARLVAVARPGTVVVSETVAAAVGGAFRLERLPATALKGFQAPAVTYRLLGR